MWSYPLDDPELYATGTLLHARERIRRELEDEDMDEGWRDMLEDSMRAIMEELRRRGALRPHDE